MMTSKKDKAAGATAPERHDPYRIRTMDQLLALFDGGAFIAETLDKHRQLQRELLDFRDEHGTKGCEGSMTIKITYALGKSGDVQMGASATFKGPKTPPSVAAAFIDDSGEITLYSPLLARMQQPVRDVHDFDPETGETRDPD